MEHLDVLIIGAGISGICAGCHLNMSLPASDYAIFDREDTLGGTWSLFKYPGIRSDSDMYTFGFPFHPWVEKNDIATAASIRKYLSETANRFKVQEKIRFNHHITSMSWCSDKQYWVIKGKNTITDEYFEVRANFIIGCTGYYDYDQAHDPQINGLEKFQGEVVHPQFWPENFHYKDKKVVVVGSGATAITLIPAMAESAAHVTMLQRSPTYIIARPAHDEIALWLKRIFPLSFAHKLSRFKNLVLSTIVYFYSRWRPHKMKTFLISEIRKELTGVLDVDRHFIPSYDPWDQRLCVVPDGDLFTSFKNGSASVVTDSISYVDSAGIKLASGDYLAADIIVTATGLKLQFLGGINVDVDGEPVDFSDVVSYRGTMFSDIPNLAVIVGYINTSWTVKADLCSRYILRLLEHMRRHNYSRVTPRLKSKLDRLPQNELQSGYFLRSIDQLPKQGSRSPWKNKTNYFSDELSMSWSSFMDEELEFEKTDH